MSDTGLGEPHRGQTRARRHRRLAALMGLLGAMLLPAGCGGGAGVPDALAGGACAGHGYAPPEQSPYVLPWPVGDAYITGLTNCASSFHAEGQPDQMAFDFNMPLGTTFLAARAGVVSDLEDQQPSGGGGGGGNYVIVDHGDGTSALYLHSPSNGILVRIGDQVVQGQPLGLVGRSGFAGYPHLHFIVVRGSTEYPYEGVAVSFRNASPADPALRGNTVYRALPY